MKNANINLEWARRILEENNRQLEIPFETIKEYAEFSAKNDPTFFSWLFGSEGDVNDYGQGMTAKQKESYRKFITDLD
jgi:hypothetical protein